MKACGEKFIINFDVKHDIHLFNNNYATIEKCNFEKVVKTFWKSASFYINLFATPHKTDTAAMTPKVRYHSLN